MRLIVVAIALAFITGSASAQTVTWTGTAADANWASDLNWSTGSAPANGATLVFSGTTQTTSTNTITSGSYGGLFFSNDGSAGNTGQFTLSGNAFTLNGPITTTAATTGTLLDTVANNIALTSTTTVTTGLNHDLTLSGIISGAGFGITKEGSGLLTLSGVNTFTGQIALNSGTLQATTSASALGAGAATLALNGGTLLLANDGNLNFGRATTLSGNATIRPGRATSAGTATTHTFGALTVAQSGTLNVDRFNVTNTANGQVTFGATTLGGDLAVTLGTRSNIQLGAVSEDGGPRSLTLESAPATTSVFILNGVGSWTGGTTVKAGQLRANVANSLGAVGSTTTVSGGALDLRNADAAAGRHLAYTGNATLQLTLSSNTTWNIGSVSQTAGTLTVTSQRASTGTGNITHVFSNPLDLNGNVTFNTLNSTSPQVTTLRVTGSITDAGGNGTLRKTGPGVLSLEAAARNVGLTQISNGTLRLGGADFLNSGTAAGNFTMDPAVDLTATLQLNGFNQTLNGFSNSGAGTSRVANDSGTNVTLTVGGNDGGGVFAGQILNTTSNSTGTLALVKTGAGMISLSGSNDYSGGTQVNAGTLVFRTTASRPAVGTTTVAAVATLGLGVGDAPGFFTVADVDNLFSGTLAGVTMANGAGVAIDTTAGNFTYATNQSAARGLTKLGNNTLTLTGSNTYSGGTTIAQGTLQIGDGTTNGSITGDVVNNTAMVFNPGTASPSTFGGSVTGPGTITKVGTGTTTLSGVSTAVGGNVAITGGAMNVTGTLNTSGNTAVGNGADARGVLRVLADGGLSTVNMTAGNNATGVGVIVVNGGTVTSTGVGTNNGLRFGVGGYGGVFLEGGTLNTGRLEMGMSNLETAVGVLRVTGGTLNNSEWALFRNNSHEITITGGTFDRTGASSAIGLAYSGTTSSLGVMTVAGGTVINSGRTVTFGQQNNNTALATGVLNLNGGTLRTNEIQTYNGSGVATSAIVNFNGGILQAATTTSDFIRYSGTSGSSTMALYAFAGGAIVDSDGFNIAINQPILAPAGSGLSGLTLAGSGSGYIGAPIVKISGGGGTGATGYATVDLDPDSPTFGQLTGVVLTNPGINYTEAPTVTLVGGGGSGAAVTPGALVANTSGGLTKLGAGTLSLTGSNTYTGVTDVQAGTLSVSPVALATSSEIRVGVNGNAALNLFADNALASLTMANDANLLVGGATTAGTLGFTLGASGSNDRIVLQGAGAVTVGTGGGWIVVSGTTGFGTGTYTLLSGPNAITNASAFQVDTSTSTTGYIYTLDYTTNSNELVLNVNEAFADLWWSGRVGSSWKTVSGGTSNWATASSGVTEAGSTPGPTTTVHFSGSNVGSSNLSTTLDGAFSLAGLDVLNSGATTLAIAPGTGGSLTLGSGGVSLQAGAPTTTISAPVVLGASQTWIVADVGQMLTLSGSVSGGLANSTGSLPGTNVSLTVTGSGAVNLANTGNTFTGDVLVDGATLQVSDLGGWGGATVADSTSKTITLQNAGTLAVLSGTLNPANAGSTSYKLVQIGSGGGRIDVAGGAILQFDDLGQLYGVGDLTKTGSGTLWLGGASGQTTYTGTAMYVNAGTLRLASALASGSVAKTIFLGATTGSADATLQLGTANNFAIPADTSFVVRGGGTGVKTIAGTNTTNTNTLNGAIDLQDNVVVSAASGGTLTLSGSIGQTGDARSLTKADAGTVILSGNNTFAGGITVNAGTLRGDGASPAGTPTTDPFGGNTITLNGGTLQVRDGGDGTTVAQTLTYGTPVIVNANATAYVDRISGTATSKIIRFGRLTLADGVTFTTTAGNSYQQFYDSSATGTNTLLGSGTFIVGTNATTSLGHGGATNSATEVSLTDGDGSYALTKTGAGTLVLGRTTVGGVITADNGTLQLNSTGNLLPGGIVVNAGTLLANASNGVLGAADSPDVKVNGGTVDLRNATSAQAVGLDYAGNGTLNLRNNSNTTFQVESLDIAATAATFTLNVNRVSGGATIRTNTFQGPITTAGPLQFNVTGGNSYQAAINANAASSFSLGGDITFNPTTANLTIDTAITDGGSNHSLTKIGNGVLILGGTNTFGGDTTPAVGEIRLTNSGALQNSTVNLATDDTGTLSFAALTSASFGGLKGTRDLVLTNTAAAPVALSVGNNNQSITYGGVLSGDGSLIKIGTGTLTLAGANSYSGGTTLSSGTLFAGSANAFGSGAITIAAAGTLDLNNFTIANTITNVGGTVLNSGSYAGTQTVTSGTATLEGGVAGTVDISTGAVADIVGEVATTGTVAISGGGRGRASGRLRGRVNISTSGTFELVDGAAVDATAVIDNGGSLRVDRTQNLEIASAIIGSGGLRKTGSARLVLSGSNSYAGPTEVHAGQLAVNGRIAGGVTVASGASLGGSGVIGGSLTGDGLIGPGNSPGILTVEGSITPTASTGFAFELTQADPIWASGTASANDVLRLTNADPFTASLQASNVVQVFLEVANLTVGDEFRGGFFIDNPNQTTGLLEAELGSATFNYFVLGDGEGLNEYNGRSYYTFAEYLTANPGLGITEVARSVVGVTLADFESGTVTTGSVTQFAIVPEPHAWALAAAGLAFMAAWQRRRAR